MKTSKFARKAFFVEGVQVTAENMQEIADWCGGEIKTGRGDSYVHVKVHHPLTERQTKAFVGDWVLYASKGFKVYTEKAFARNFDPQLVEGVGSGLGLTTGHPVGLTAVSGNASHTGVGSGGLNGNSTGRV